MVEISIGLLVKTALPIVARMPLLRRLFAERKAANEPLSIAVDVGEPLLDGALSRLGSVDEADPSWKVVAIAIGASFVRPKEFYKPYVREWLSRDDVRQALKSLVRSRISGAPENPKSRELLLETYSNQSGEDQRYAKAVIETALAFLKASLEGSVGDSGTAALVQAGFESVHDRLDQLLQSELSLLPLRPVVASERIVPPIDIQAVEQAFGIVSRVLLDWPQETDGHWIDRPELAALHASATQIKPAVTVLLGRPGEGKSAVLARLGKQLCSEGILLLAIKADQVPRSVGTLPELSAWIAPSGPIAEALRQIAADRRVVLLIDQLDALSELMDQHSERLSALLRLVDAVRGIPNLQVLLSCREFEFRHDIRLNTLDADAVHLAAPPWEYVEPLLNARGVVTTGWNDEARDLLRTPQHLSVFLTHLAGSGYIHSIASYQGLLERVVRERLEQKYGVRTLEAAERIATEMACEEELWLGRARFEGEFGQELHNLLAAEFLILSENGLSLSFRHQTLFDFLRSRAFLRGRLSLAEYVISEKQESLFVRPILWSALHYLRGSDRAAYRREFRRLWSYNELRLHLRYLLVSFLGQLPDPDDEEAVWLLPALADPRLRPKILRAMVNSPGWFTRVLSRLPSLMAAPPTEAWETVTLLSRATTFNCSKVLELVEQHWLSHDEYTPHALRIFYDLMDWDDISIELASKIADRAPLDNFSIRHIALVASKSQPRLAPGILFRYLLAMTKKLESDPAKIPAPPLPDAPAEEEIEWKMEKERQISSPFERLLDTRTDWHDVGQLAARAPQAFIERGWPWLLSIAERLSSEENPRLLEYRGFRGLSFSHEDDERERHPLPTAFETAIRGFAQGAPLEFIEFVDSNKRTDLMVIHHLLALGLEQIAERYPAFVLSYLLEDPRRLSIGDMYDVHRNSRGLIAAVVPMLDAQGALALEHTIIGWRRYRDLPEDEDARSRFDRRKWSREHKLRLLRSFPLDRLSPKSRRHLEEEQRALPYASDFDIGPIKVSYVGSSMPSGRMQKANDGEIVKLFDELTDDTGWDHPSRRWDHVGGSIQASRAFAEFAKDAPERALNIIERFKAKVQERPAGMALAAVGDSGIASSTLIETIRKLNERGFVSPEFRSNAAQCLRQIAFRNKGLDESTCALLESWIAEFSSNAGDDANNGDDSESQGRHESLLWAHGQLEIVPDGNYPLLEALMLGFLLREPAVPDGWLAVLERHIERNENPKVWIALAHHLRHLANADRDRSINFVEALLIRHPYLLRTTAGVQLIAQTHDWLPSALVDHIIECWISGNWSRGPQAAGELAALALFRKPKDLAVYDRVERFVAGSDYLLKVAKELRLGLIHTAATAWREQELRPLSTSMLVRLMMTADDDDAALDALHSVFGTDTLRADEYTRQLLSAFLERPSIFSKHRNHFLIDQLKQLLRDGWEPQIIHAVSSAVVGQAGADLGNVQTSWAINGDDLVEIALTLHRLPETRVSGLQLFERLMSFEAYGLNERLGALDRRPV